jgi:hypothetical protein
MDEMSNTGMNRRQFLQTSSLAAAGAAVVASGSVLMASDGAWALELGALSGHQGVTLLKMSRQLYPHASLGDVYYAGVVESLDSGAKADVDLAGLLKDGVTQLDAAKGVNWIDLSDGYQLEVLRSMEATPFFQKVRGSTVVGLYNNPLVWRHFGYEGASYEFGGYIERGFDDMSWAGEPSEDASPKAG